ncbi:MAG: nucleotidyltransferase domain-containing protein [Patescibacteria group bacterium]|nr:nucleotidyltransferase domain-containing protein [Patescibacteria group bacterium]
MKFFESKKNNLEFMLRAVKTLMYCRVSQWEPNLVEMGQYFIGQGVSKIKRVPGQDLEILGRLKFILDWFLNKGVIFVKSGSFWWKGRRILGQGLAGNSLYLKKVSNEKMKIAVRTAKIIKHLPFIRMISVCGTVAGGNAREDSDIDFLVITKPGRIFLARFFLMLALEILGKRKKSSQIKDRICLNHFIARDTLLVKYRDLYSAMEYAKMVCLIDREKTLADFLKTNAWIGDYLTGIEWDKRRQLSNFWQEQVVKKSGDSTVYRLTDKILGSKFFDWLERFLAYWQIRRIKRKREKQKGGQVYWGDEALIFHPEPKSDYTAKRFRDFMDLEEETIRSLIRQEWQHPDALKART